MRRRVSQPRFGWFIAGFASLAILLAWFALDQSLPRNDFGYNFETTQNIYEAFRHDGFFSGLWHFYFDRNMRPVLQPVVGVFFLALSGGSIHWTIALNQALYSLMFSFFAWRLLARHLKGAALAVAGLTVVLIPWVLRGAVCYSTDLPMIACAAAVYHYLDLMIAQGPFKDRDTSLKTALWVALMLCMRPIDTVLVLVLPLLLLMVRAFSTRAIVLRDIVAFGAVAGAVSIAFGYQIAVGQNKPPQAFWPYLGIPVLLLVLLPLRKRLRLHVPFFDFWFPIVLIGTFWYAAFASAVYRWGFASSFGLMAKITGMRNEASWLHFLGQVSWQIAGAPVLLLLLLGAVSGRFSLRKEISRFRITLLACIVLVPIILGALSYNGDIRYYCVSGLALWLFALAWALNLEGAFRFPRLAVGGGLVLLFLLLSVERVGGPSLVNLGRLPSESWLMSELIAPYPSREQDPAVAVFRALAADLPPQGRGEVCLLQMRQFNDLDWLADPWAISLVARENGLRWHFARPFPHEFSTAEDKFEKQVKPRCHYVVILPLEYVAAPIEHFMSDVGEKMIGLWKKGRLAQEGFDVIAKQPFSAPSGHAGEMLVLRNRNVEP